VSSKPLLNISDLSVKYETAGDTVTALDHVSLTIPSVGYTLGVVGESGSGKTTLGMSIINSIEPPGRIYSGSLEFFGRDVVRMSKRELRDYQWREVSMIYQSAMNALNPVKKISDPIAEVLRYHNSASKSEAYGRALKMLEEVGIGRDRAFDYPHELSGGMRQRVVIALALSLSPKLLIADEPTSALDVVVQHHILSLLKREIAERDLSLIFITHEISLLRGLVDNIAVMYAGEVVEVGPLDAVMNGPLHPYTEMLRETLLTMESKRSMLSETARVTDGSELAAPAGACKYVNRCKYAFERCRREAPLLKENKDGRWVACHKFD
jgi:oligopeptide/dipeptide ABC transporter ATP-binding protein